MEAIGSQYRVHCFDPKLGAKNGYGALLPTALFISGIVGLGAAAWLIDPYMTLGTILCAVGLALFISSLVLFSRRQRVRLTAFAVGADGKVYRAKRSGSRGVGLFAAGELTGELADTLLGSTVASDAGGLVGSVAGIVAVNKLIKAMGTPSVIETMLENPAAVCGAEMICIEHISDWTESPVRYLLHCSGTNIKTGRNFRNKRIRIAKAYAQPDTLHSALGALE